MGGMGGFSIILCFSSQAKQSWTLFKEPLRSVVGLALHASRGMQRTARPTNLIGRRSHSGPLFANQPQHYERICCVARERDTSFFVNCFGLLKQTGQEFLEDKATQLGAALAY